MVNYPQLERPILTGTNLVCVNNPYQLSLEAMPLLHYRWELNGQPRPDLYDFTSLTETQSVAGVYIYTVKALYEYYPGYFCESDVSTYTVTVTEPPSIPLIDVQVVSCDPYLVKLHVTNIQSGVTYNWSNGMVGTDIIVEHDGALLVRAEVFNCSAESQVDLPRDLTKIKWSFPSGCFDVCSKKGLGYLLGPGGTFSSWSWYESGMLVSDGIDAVLDLAPIHLNQEYSLIVQEGSCSTTLQMATIKDKNCTTCPLEVLVEQIECITVGESVLYSITIRTFNSHSSYLNAQVSLDGNFGYFETSTLLVPPGQFQQVLVLHGNSQSVGATLMMQIESMLNDELCYSEFPIQLASNCVASAQCPDQLRFDGKYTCISTLSGPLYQVEFSLNNPNSIGIPFSVVTSVNGILTPSQTLLPPGNSTITFGFQPDINYNGDPVTFSILCNLTPLNCPLTFEARLLPDNCSDPLDCHVMVDHLIAPCIDPSTQSMGVVSVELTNTFTTPLIVTLHVPGQELTLSQSLFTILPGVHTPIVFIPTAINGFTGGQVVLEIIGFDGIRFCTQRLILEIEICCPNCKVENALNPEDSLIKSVLKVAPNQVLDATKIFYIFEGDVSSASIDIVDVTGRVLYTQKPDSNHGVFDLNCRGWSAGIYTVVLRIGQVPTLATRMIIKN